VEEICSLHKINKSVVINEKIIKKCILYGNLILSSKNGGKMSPLIKYENHFVDMII